MAMQKMLLLLLLAVASSAVGCAAQDRVMLLRPAGTAPHDPAPGRLLFEQIPNWDRAAWQRCGGHLTPEQRLPGQSGRC